MADRIKPVRAWAITVRGGGIYRASIRPTRDAAIASVLIHGHPPTWRQLYRQGWRAIPQTVTPETTPPPAAA